jgi:hypothetical protein
MRRYGQFGSFDEQPIAELNSEALDFRAASEQIVKVPPPGYDGQGVLVSSRRVGPKGGWDVGTIEVVDLHKQDQRTTLLAEPGSGFDLYGWCGALLVTLIAPQNGRETWLGSSIAEVNLLSGGVRVVSSPNTSALFPAWSPGGDDIAYVQAPVGRDHMNERRIWVMRRNGGQMRQLISGSNDREENPIWLSNHTMMFCRIDGSYHASLWSATRDGLHFSKLADLPVLPDEAWGYYGYVDWGEYFDVWLPPPMRLTRAGYMAGNGQEDRVDARSRKATYCPPAQQKLPLALIFGASMTYGGLSELLGTTRMAPNFEAPQCKAAPPGTATHPLGNVS